MNDSETAGLHLLMPGKDSCATSLASISYFAGEAVCHPFPGIPGL